MAISPNTDVSTGTVRQPINVKHSFDNSSSNIFLESAASIGSVLRNIMPTAYFLPSFQLLSAATARKKLSGFCNNRPQPSPVLPSLAIPPRCCIRSKAEMAVLISL